MPKSNPKIMVLNFVAPLKKYDKTEQRDITIFPDAATEILAAYDGAVVASDFGEENDGQRHNLRFEKLVKKHTHKISMNFTVCVPAINSERLPAGYAGPKAPNPEMFKDIDAIILPLDINTIKFDLNQRNNLSKMYTSVAQSLETTVARCREVAGNEVPILFLRLPISEPVSQITGVSQEGIEHLLALDKYTFTKYQDFSCVYRKCSEVGVHYTEAVITEKSTLTEAIELAIKLSIVNPAKEARKFYRAYIDYTLKRFFFSSNLPDNLDVRGIINYAQEDLRRTTAKVCMQLGWINPNGSPTPAGAEILDRLALDFNQTPDSPDGQLRKAKALNQVVQTLEQKVQALGLPPEGITRSTEAPKLSQSPNSVWNSSPPLAAKEEAVTQVPNHNLTFHS